MKHSYTYSTILIRKAPARAAQGLFLSSIIMQLYSRAAILAVLLFTFAGSSSLSAQTLIGGLAFGADGNDIGIRFGVFVPVTEIVDAGADFAIFFPGNDVDIYEFNANGRYALPIKSELRVFAIAGLNFTNVSVSGRDGKSHTGVNLGGMIQSKGSGPLGFYMDAKFILGGIEQLEVGGGVTYDL